MPYLDICLAKTAISFGVSDGLPNPTVKPDKAPYFPIVAKQGQDLGSGFSVGLRNLTIQSS